MDKFLLTEESYFIFLKEINNELSQGAVYVTTNRPGSIGKIGMLKLWRAWMKNTAEYMAEKGVTMPLMIAPDKGNFGERPFNEQDCHELFTNQWLGSDENGKRLSWAKNPHDGMRTADKGERFDALRKHEAWSTERGIQLYNPADSEYMKIQKEMEQ